MKRLAIVGASGHGKVVAEIAKLSGYNDIIFFDDAFPELNSIGIWSVIGNTEVLISNCLEYDGCIVAIGNNSIRLKKTIALQGKGAKLTTLVHPNSVVSSYSSLGTGSVVMANAVINPFVSLGMACIVNTSATIDHDCVLDDGVHISPGVNLAGAVTIGKKSWVGIGASVKQGITIGNDSCIGAGAAVISNVEDNVIVTGVPAKLIKRNG